jgi:hypothetical protein
MQIIQSFIPIIVVSIGLKKSIPKKFNITAIAEIKNKVAITLKKIK